jgi:hypothetical protein
MRVQQGQAGRTASGLRRLPLAAATGALLVSVVAWSPAMAAGAGNRSGPITALPATVGSDISWPQCAGAYPAGQAFGIVGVNGGLPDDANNCFSSELRWALTSSGATSQPKASIYVNTADPGDVYHRQPIADWPASGSTPYGACALTPKPLRGKKIGQNSPACAYEYGYQRGTYDKGLLANASATISTRTVGGYHWWLDVETGNTWQTGTSGIKMNVADLQGLVAALKANGAPSVGVYSTPSQWHKIVGSTPGTWHTPKTPSGAGTLDTLPVWVPGASNETQAQAKCSSSATRFTGGAVQLTQWTATYDEDRAC